MSREQCPVELGDLARDGITGFTGVVTAITEWLNGCVRVTIQPAGLHEGKPDDSYTFDVERVKAVKGAGFKPNVAPQRRSEIGATAQPKPNAR